MPSGLHIQRQELDGEKAAGMPTLVAATECPGAGVTSVRTCGWLPPLPHDGSMTKGDQVHKHRLKLPGWCAGKLVCVVPVGRVHQPGGSCRLAPCTAPGLARSQTSGMHAHSGSQSKPAQPQPSSMVYTTYASCMSEAALESKLHRLAYLRMLYVA